MSGDVGHARPDGVSETVVESVGLMGRVDILAQQAADGLDGRWTFPVVEELGRTFDEPFRRAEARPAAVHDDTLDAP